MVCSHCVFSSGPASRHLRSLTPLLSQVLAIATVHHHHAIYLSSTRPSYLFHSSLTCALQVTRLCSTSPTSQCTHDVTTCSRGTLPYTHCHTNLKNLRMAFDGPSISLDWPHCHQLGLPRFTLDRTLPTFCRRTFAFRAGRLTQRSFLKTYPEAVANSSVHCRPGQRLWVVAIPLSLDSSSHHVRSQHLLHHACSFTRATTQTSNSSSLFYFFFVTTPPHILYSVTAGVSGGDLPPLRTTILVALADSVPRHG